MFAAAMLYSTPGLELSIYSTCKRISQKLMRNVTKFVDLIYDALGTPHMSVIRSNMEEVVLQGPDGRQDVRIVNSYPSKVMFLFLLFLGAQQFHAQGLAGEHVGGIIRLLKLLHHESLSCGNLQGL